MSGQEPIGLPDLATLGAVAREVAGAADLDAVLASALAYSLDSLSLPAGLIRLPDPEGRELVIRASRGFPAEVLREVVRLPIPDSPPGGVFRAGTPLWVEDLAEQPDKETALTRRFGIRSYGCVPLRAGDRVVGTLSIGSREPHRFSARDLQILEAIGGLVGLAVQHAGLVAEARRQAEGTTRLYAEVARNVERLSLLYDLSAQLHASLSLEEILADAMRQVVRTFGAKSAVVFLFDGAGQVSSRVGVWLSPAHERGDLPRPHGLTRTILATGQPVSTRRPRPGPRPGATRRPGTGA